MRMEWSEVGIAALLAGGACAAVYAGVQRSLRRAIAEQQTSTERQIAALSATVKALQARVAELNRLLAERSGEVAAMEAAAENAPARNDGMKPEMMAVITAAAATFLGKRAQVRSAQPVQAREQVSAWTQQGRMIVQTSHDLHARD